MPESPSRSGISETQRKEYIARINRVIDYIERNPDRRLTLEELASVANFSRFHFHRIFRAMVGETLNRFIQRIRLEKAASHLIEKPHLPITEIALNCGFSGSSAFARAFRETFGMSAGQWREENARPNRKTGQHNSKIRQTVRNSGQDIETISLYIDPQTHNPIWRITMTDNVKFDVEVKEMPEMNVAYVRHVGPYKSDGALFESLFQKLMGWAAPRGLLRFPETRMLSVYHDDPNITDESQLRTSICITVPPDTGVDGEIGSMTVPGGKYAVARFEILEDQYEQAWTAVMGDWLPQSGLQPDDGVCYEIYNNNPNEHPEKKHIVDICIPVKPL